MIIKYIDTAFLWYTNIGTTAASTIGAGTNSGYYMRSHLRFLSIPVYKSAVITSAILSIKPNSGVGLDIVETVVNGEAVDSSSEVISQADGQSRSSTTAAVNADGFTVDVFKLIDVKAIIKEITSRSGWRYGNNLAFLWSYRSGDNNYAYGSGAVSGRLVNLEINGPGIGYIGGIQVF